MIFLTSLQITRFWSRVDKSGGPDACWPWTAAQSGNGYGAFQTSTRQEASHRVAWTLKHGAIPDGLFICHHCDNPLCCNESHLFLGSNRDNLRDAARKGRTASGDRNWAHAHPELTGLRLHPEKAARGDRSGRRLHPERWPAETRARGARHGSHTHPEAVARGERCHTAKLTQDQVIQARALRVLGMSYRRIAARFGVEHSTIQNICKRRTWTHVLDFGAAVVAETETGGGIP